jgi:hypothetical protein
VIVIGIDTEIENLIEVETEIRIEVHRERLG